MRKQQFLTLGVYWLSGVVCSIFFAYIITDHTFNFFEGNDLWALSYNYYYLSLLEGRQDIPLKVIGFEGLYLNDGTAYMYYGVVPAFLRAFFSPFVDLTVTPVSRAIVWGLTISSGFVAQRTFLYCLLHSGIQHQGLFRATLWIGGGAIWLVSPLLILTSGASVYHEPIAMAFLCIMLSIHLFILIIHKNSHTALFVILLAILAGLALLSRPHVGVGLYVGTCLLLIWSIGCYFVAMKAESSEWRLGIVIRDHLYAFLVLFILGLCGVAYILLALPRIGLFESSVAESMTYGVLFFAFESPDSIRQIGFENDGRFNLLRVLPNLFNYSFGGSYLFHALRSLVGLSFVRIEDPAAPLISLWLPWIALSVSGVWSYSRKYYRAASRRTLRNTPAIIIFFSILIVTVFILSYGTITHRYKVEIWPILWITSILFLPVCIRSVENNLPAYNKYLRYLIVIVALSSIYSIFIANHYGRYFTEMRLWTYPECAYQIRKLSVTPALPLTLCD